MDVMLDTADLDAVLAHPVVVGLLAATSDAAVVIDARDRRILGVNDRARALLSLDDAALGCGCAATLDSPACAQACPLSRAVDGRPVPSAQELYYRRHGQRVPARARMLVLRGPDGAAVAGIELIEDRREVHGLRLALRARCSLHGLTGRSVAMQDLYDRIDALGPTDLPVLVRGAPGVGKRRVAAALHQASSAAAQPLDAVGLRGLPAAQQAQAVDRALAQTGPGALVLVGAEDLDAGLADRLADALQGHARPPAARLLFTLRTPGALPGPLGDLLAATTVDVPGLDRRLDDLPALVDALLAEQALVDGVAPPSPTADGLALLAGRAWPGHVAELEGLLQVARQVAPPDGRLDASVLQAAAAGVPPQPLARIEADAIARALAHCDGNVSAAARLLGIDRTTLWRKLRGASKVTDPAG